MHLPVDSRKLQEHCDLILIQNPGYGGSYQSVASHLGIAGPTLRNILDRKLARVTTITAISKKLGCLESDILDKTKVKQLPATSNFYTTLNFGYFIDQPRSSAGKPAIWHKELISLKHRHSKGQFDWFDGQIENKPNGKFDVEACLISGKSFAILASNEKKHDSFVASFSCLTHPLSDACNDVICGVWTGRDTFDRLAVYRMFCSTKPLQNNQIQELLLLTPIMQNFQTE